MMVGMPTTESAPVRSRRASTFPLLIEPGIKLLNQHPADASDFWSQAKQARLAAFTNSAREGIDTTDKLEDADTADLFTQISRCADNYLYFLEAHLQD